jgi:2-hydroxychromene-2-carboxylate isomerase
VSAPIFYFDVGSPYAYLAAERVERFLPGAVRWQPILVGGLFKRLGTTSWAFGPERARNIAEVERRAASYGLPPFRWPREWPNNTLLAMRVASSAGEQGHAREFGVRGVPGLVVGRTVFFGDDRLDEAVAAVRRS